MKYFRLTIPVLALLVATTATLNYHPWGGSSGFYFGYEVSFGVRRIRQALNIKTEIRANSLNGLNSIQVNAVNSDREGMGVSRLIFEAYPYAQGVARMDLKVKADFYGQGVGDVIFSAVMEEVRKLGVRYATFDFPCPYCVDPEYVSNFLKRQEDRGLIKNIIYVPSDIFVPNTTPPGRYAIFEICYLDYVVEDNYMPEEPVGSDIAEAEDVIEHIQSGEPIQALAKIIPPDKIRVIGELPVNRFTNSPGFITSAREPIGMLDFSEFITALNYLKTTSTVREAGDIAIYRDSKGKISFIGIFINAEWVVGLWLDKLVVECREEFLPRNWINGKATYYRRIK